MLWVGLIRQFPDWKLDEAARVHPLGTAACCRAELQVEGSLVGEAGKPVAPVPNG